jgi:hypothetical protein
MDLSHTCSFSMLFMWYKLLLLPCVALSHCKLNRREKHRHKKIKASGNMKL